MRLLRWTVLICLLACGGTAAFAKDWKVIRVGTEGAYPPFNYVDSDHNLQGFDVDIAYALCKQIGAKCEIVAQNWDGLLPALTSGKFDVIIASMVVTNERKKVVDFTNIYYRTFNVFVAVKNSGITAVDPQSLAGKTIGIQSATTYGNFLEDKYKGSTLKYYPTQDEANADLAAGRLDLTMADQFALYDWLTKSVEGKACCEFVGSPIVDPAYFGEGAGMAVRKSDPDLREKLNEALDAIVADGTYEKINAKYFPFPLN